MNKNQVSKNLGGGVTDFLGGGGVVLWAQNQVGSL